MKKNIAGVIAILIIAGALIAWKYPRQPVVSQPITTDDRCSSTSTIEMQACLESEIIRIDGKIDALCSVGERHPEACTDVPGEDVIEELCTDSIGEWVDRAAEYKLVFSQCVLEEKERILKTLK